MRVSRNAVSQMQPKTVLSNADKTQIKAAMNLSKALEKMIINDNSNVNSNNMKTSY